MRKRKRQRKRQRQRQTDRDRDGEGEVNRSELRTRCTSRLPTGETVLSLMYVVVDMIRLLVLLFLLRFIKSVRECPSIYL